MPDWAFEPRFNYGVEYIGPETLVSTFEDGTEIRREKNSTIRRRFTEVHSMSKTNMNTALEFYRTKGTYSTFDKYTYDADDATNVTTTVRFERPPEYEQVAYNLYRAKFYFIEVV